MKKGYILILLLCFTSIASSQKRIKPPKTLTNIESIDNFVQSSYTIYDVVFDFHYGKTQELIIDEIQESESNEDTPEDTLNDPATTDSSNINEFATIETHINSMIEQLPLMLEIIENQSVAKQIKATLNLNKAIKVLRKSGQLIKMTIKGE